MQAGNWSWPAFSVVLGTFPDWQAGQMRAQIPSGTRTLDVRGQKPSASAIAWAKAWGASWGRLCPTPPSITRCAYLPENLPA